MLHTQTAQQLAEADAKSVEEKDAQPKQYLTRLAGHIKHAFAEADTHRQTCGATDRMIKSKRLKSGVYEPAKLAEIQRAGGSTMFFNITAPKCEAAEAWLADVFSGAGERPWDLEPSPIPSLSTDEADSVKNLTVQYFAEKDAIGEPYEPEEVGEFASDLYDATLRKSVEVAEEKAVRMATKIQDQVAEGGFEDALSEFFTDLAEYPTAVIKGPVFSAEKRLKWKEGQTTVESEVIPHWYCVDPMRFYPGPNATTVNDSYICEVIDFDRGALSRMRDVEGWDKASIEKVLGLDKPDRSMMDLVGESSMGELEDKDETINGGQTDATIRAVEFWGSVQGSLLLEWGMEDIPDPFEFYEVNCIMVNDVVIRAILNPNPTGNRPYYVSSYVKKKNSLWGLASIPEKMEDCQVGVNGCQRNLMDNLAFSAGPQTSVDLDAIPASHIPTVNKQYPRKVWPFHGNKTQNQNPIRFFQPNSNANELLSVTEYYEKKADDRTLIPRYVMGDQNLSGAAATASGLGMLMGASSRGIKRVIKNVDKDILRPAVESMYIYNMLHLDDDSLKGDAQVIPRGALAMLVREQTQLRRNEYLAMTNNPTDLEIIGIERRANLLREVAKGLDLPAGKVVPSEDELKARVKQAQQQPEAQPGGGEQPPKGQPPTEGMQQ